MNLTADQVRWVLIRVFVLLISVALHEFGHAIMADKLGDDTPRRQGRVTLNPLAHADPIGTLLIPLVGGLYGAASGRGGGFGWGKPVQWQPHKIRRGIKMTTASILVAIAGPLMNVFLAVVVAITCTILAWQKVIALPDPVTHAGGDMYKILTFTVATNFVLFFFNLVPAPPLDGGHVLQNVLPRRYLPQFEQYAKYGPIVVMAVALIPQLAQIFLVPAAFCTRHLLEGLAAIFGG